MNAQISLHTDGFSIDFTLQSIQGTDNYVNLTGIFRLMPYTKNILIDSVPTLISFSDLRRLLTYFEQHIAHLQQDPNHKSEVFVPVNLGFQAEALTGEIRSQHDGEFSLRFMLNLGKQSEESTYVYIGGEAVVSLESISSFTSDLKSTLENLALSS